MVLKNNSLMFFTQSQSGLWLPVERLLNQGGDSAYPPMIGIYIKYSELADSKLTLSQIDNILRKYPGVNLILNALRINFLLSINSELDSTTQQLLVKELLPQCLARFNSFQDTHKREQPSFAFSHVRPLFTSFLPLQLIKRILLKHPGFDVYEELNNKPPQDFGVAIAALSDHVKTMENSDFPNMVRNHCFQDHTNHANLILRFHSLLFETPQLPDFIEKNLIPTEFYELFEKATGIALNIYFALGVILLNAICNPKIAAQQGGLPWLEMCQFQWDKTIAPMQIADTYKLQLKTMLTIDLYDAKEWFTLRDTTSTSTTFDFYPFLQKPILELIPNSMCIPVLSFLKEQFSDGIFYKVTDYLSNNKELTGKFRIYWGHLIEEYGKSLFKKYINSSPFSPSFTDGDKLYKIGKQEHKTTDLICYVEKPHNELFLIDFTKSFFRMDAILLENNWDAVYDAIRELIKKAKSIHRTIQHFKEKKFFLKGLDPSAINVFRPIIVSTRSFPLNPVFWQGDGNQWIGLSKFLTATGADRDFRIRPLKLIDMTEFENLCFRAEKKENPFDTIRNWTNEPILCDFPLSEYWHWRSAPFSMSQIGLKQDADRIYAKCREILKFPDT